MAKPAPLAKFRVRINLLHPNEIPAPLPARFLKWLISYGRYIVIFTEVIVVGAFVYRFKLDADLDTLKTQINKDLPYVEALSTDEAIIKQTQLKLATVQNVYTFTPNWQQAIESIAAEQPRSVRINLISMDSLPSTTQVKLRISGSTSLNSDLAYFIRRLKDKKDENDKNILKDISLDTVNFDQNQLIFIISGVYIKPN